MPDGFQTASFAKEKPSTIKVIQEVEAALEATVPRRNIGSKIKGLD